MPAWNKLIELQKWWELSTHLNRIFFVFFFPFSFALLFFRNRNRKMWWRNEMETFFVSIFERFVTIHNCKDFGAAKVKKKKNLLSLILYWIEMYLYLSIDFVILLRHFFFFLFSHSFLCFSFSFSHLIRKKFHYIILWFSLYFFYILITSVHIKGHRTQNRRVKKM